MKDYYYYYYYGKYCASLELCSMLLFFSESLDMVAVGKLDDGKWHASVNQKETAWALLSILINMRNYKF